MRQYLDLLQEILDEGVKKESGRPNMPNTIGISKADIKMDLQDGFPLLTTKKMFWKGIVHELLWFLRGETNIKYLVDNGVNIWNDDAYRWYLKYHKINTEDVEPLTMEDFVNIIKIYKFNIPWFSSDNYYLGDLGKVYGAQWRNQNGVDQIQEIMDSLKNNPYSRYHILDGWNKADFNDMALPPCHLLYQFIVRPLTPYQRENWYAKKYGFTQEQREKMTPNTSDEDIHEIMSDLNVPKFYLDLNMYQRSVDTALGNPYNLASMSLLLMLVAKANNMVAGISNWIGGDTHIYVSHIVGIDEQLKREPYKLPEMKINKDLNSLDDILNLSIDDFDLVGYESHPTINFELFVGLEKK